MCGVSLEINIPFILELTDKEGHEEANIFLSRCFATFFFASLKQDAQRKSQNFFFSLSHFLAVVVCGTSEGEKGKERFRRRRLHYRREGRTGLVTLIYGRFLLALRLMCTESPSGGAGWGKSRRWPASQRDGGGGGEEEEK